MIPMHRLYSKYRLREQTPAESGEGPLQSAMVDDIDPATKNLGITGALSRGSCRVIIAKELKAGTPSWLVWELSKNH